MKARSTYNKHFLTPLIAGLAILTLLSSVSCNKQNEWLDVKRSNSDVMPSSLKDLQAVLDNSETMNINYPQLALLCADNNVITDQNLSAAGQTERNAYLWAKDIYEGQIEADWQLSYQRILYTNIVIDGLDKLDRNTSNQIEYDNVLGSALFYRSMAFYQLAQEFCKPYDASTGETDLGIPIRLTSDVNMPSVRATVQQTYNQMIDDLRTAVELLPQSPLFTTRPSNVAVNALLAKIYLSMEDYDNAELYANLVLNVSNTLLDFNSEMVSEALTYRFPTFNPGNPEVIFYSEAGLYFTLGAWASGRGQVDPALYDSYSENDLRKTLFFSDYGNGHVKFQGTYTGNTNNFAGIATNEIYLIRAECRARKGDFTGAMQDLNGLLLHRYENDGSFIPLVADNAETALRIILEERRKELPYTGLLRWEDLRRLNKDPRFAVILERNYLGETYTLPPNDRKYVLPIPDSEIQMFGLVQNER